MSVCTWWYRYKGVASAGTLLATISNANESTVRDVSFRPVRVPGDTLSWHFKAMSKDNGKATHYGFHFTVSQALGTWTCEGDVLKNPSVDWACWLLEFLLNDAADLLGPGDVGFITAVDCNTSSRGPRIARAAFTHPFMS